MKTLYFISGLPRSGSGLIGNILRQNPSLYCENSSSLANMFNLVNSYWYNSKNPTFQTTNSKNGALMGLLQGYYQHVNESIIFDNNLQWPSLIPVLESVLQKEIKILICVRNPAEILTSFERSRKENPTVCFDVDMVLKDKSSIASRAFYYAGPDGILGQTHRNIKDAIVMGYLDRMLFVDYSRFCNSPKSQVARIYDFLKLSQFEHNFNNIEQINPITFAKETNSINKKTTNCVEYLGLDIYEQYNREIFWNAWI